ncbi:MAG: hypothetical protein JNM91_14425, partial [Flavobacteriales bacterium]|nr:hypothetical protein [Flavobacteriales bacterium]
MNPYSFRSRVLAALLPAMLSLAPFHASRAGDGCPAEAGTLTSDFGPICLVNGQATLTGVPNGDAVVPDGYTTLYVLTRTNGLIIEQVSADPVFTVTSEDVWRLHSLVYDPATLDLSVVQTGSTNAYQVQDLLVQGGGSICAALDISGAPVKTGICPCDADAGGITTDFGPICLVNGEATLTGVPTGNAEVPAGYSTLYVLTRTNGLIIEQVSTDPVFTVTTEDVWRIHTLVYDPATLDLSIVQFGSTNAYQVQDLLIQGGGTICASLDISGAPAKTGICEQVCTADAGTISADQADLCLTNGSASLMATPDGNANVPVGYQVVFVLTEGPDLVIANAGPVPMFTVTDPGSYIVHTLVYDPATLDLSSIVFGETTGAAVNSLLQQGGGSICASLDLVGAQFQVADCTPLCTADAGTLTAAEPELCLVNGLATMTAVPTGDAVVPDGFVVAYVLTRGPELFIQNVEPDPEFEWPLTGEYTVHTLVYDPATLDLGWIQFDVSTGFDVNALLLQGGGSICGSLDVLGASFTITQCEEPCTANAGSNASVTVCSNAPAFDLFSLVNGDPGGSWIAPDGTPNLSIFSPGLDAPGTYMYVVSATEPCPNDTAFVTVAVSLAPDAGISAQV